MARLMYHPCHVGLAMAMVLAGVARATPAPPFAQLLDQASHAPHAQILDAEVERADGLSRQARARPNPTLSLYSDNLAGGGPYAGFGSSETTLQLNQPLELGGKRSARIAAGEAGLAAARAKSLDGRIAFAADLARAHAAVEVAERQIELAQDEVEEAGDVLNLAKAMVAAGKESRLRQLQAETELNTLQADLAGCLAERSAALAHLSALAGVAQAFTGLSESLLARMAAKPATGPVDPLQNAAVLAAQAEQRAAQARVEVEQRRATPDVTVQFGVRRLEANRANALVAGVSIPLGVFDQNRGNIAAAQGEQRSAQAREEAIRLEAQAALMATMAQIAAAQAKADAAQKTLTTAQEAYRLAQIAYEGGKAPLSELIDARHRLGLARASLLQADMARFDARANLARLQGRTITGDVIS
jgi:cobalt-zinc-cadmium efflux system outer membrane protein